MAAPQNSPTFHRSDCTEITAVIAIVTEHKVVAGRDRRGGKRVVTLLAVLYAIARCSGEGLRVLRVEHDYACEATNGLVKELIALGIRNRQLRNFICT